MLGEWICRLSLSERLSRTCSGSGKVRAGLETDLALIPDTGGYDNTFVGFGSYMFNQILGIGSFGYASVAVLLLATCIWTVATILVIGSAVSWFARWISGKEAETPIRTEAVTMVFGCT